MGRKRAFENGLGRPFWVRLPLELDAQVRGQAQNQRKMGAIIRELVLEALAARESRNRATETGEIRK